MCRFLLGFFSLSFWHVYGSCRVTSANRGEKAAKIRRRYLLPVTSAERNDSESEGSNIINTEKWPLAKQVMKKNQNLPSKRFFCLSSCLLYLVATQKIAH